MTSYAALPSAPENASRYVMLPLLLRCTRCREPYPPVKVMWAFRYTDGCTLRGLCGDCAFVLYPDDRHRPCTRRRRLAAVRRWQAAQDESHRCIDCGTVTTPMTEWTLYDPTLGRSLRPYCERCGSKATRLDVRR